MLTSEQQVLLMQVQELSKGFKIWITPGRGVENGEDAETCLHREIQEETGATQIKIGPHIWHRHHIFEWNNQMLSQKEDYYLIPIEHFEPDMQTNPSETELMDFQQFKWWTLEEISTSQDEFAPRLLAEHLQSLLRERIVIPALKTTLKTTLKTSKM